MDDTDTYPIREGGGMADEERTGDRKAPEDRTDEGQEQDYHGDAVTDNPMAPASAGIPHGTGGTVDPREGGPDQRPVTSDRSPSAEEEDASEETPVPSPVSREGEGRAGSASAGAASKAAGSAAPTEKSSEE